MLIDYLLTFNMHTIQCQSSDWRSSSWKQSFGVSTASDFLDISCKYLCLIWLGTDLDKTEKSMNCEQTCAYQPVNKRCVSKDKEMNKSVN